MLGTTFVYPNFSDFYGKYTTIKFKTMLRIRIRILRIHMFWASWILVRGMNPDPSIVIKQK